MRGVHVCPHGSCKNILVPLLAAPGNGRKRMTRVRGFAHCPRHGIVKLPTVRRRKKAGSKEDA